MYFSSVFFTLKNVYFSNDSMSESLGGTPMTIFHIGYCKCEGVGWDSGYVVGGFISCMI